MTLISLRKGKKICYIKIASVTSLWKSDRQTSPTLKVLHKTGHKYLIIKSMGFHLQVKSLWYLHISQYPLYFNLLRNVIKKWTAIHSIYQPLNEILRAFISKIICFTFHYFVLDALFSIAHSEKLFIHAWSKKKKKMLA